MRSGIDAPDRVNIPCLMHDNRPCQLDVKRHMTSTEHIRYKLIQNLLRCKNRHT